MRPDQFTFALAMFISVSAPVRALPAPVPADTVIQAPTWSAGSNWYYSDGYGLKVSSSNNGVTVFERLDAPGQWFSRQGFLRKDLISATATRNSIYRTLSDQLGGSLSAAAPLTFQREYLSNGKLLVHASSWTLEGRETITVPAGTFDCWVIVWRTRSLKSDWTGFERWWYSPAAQNYVRLEYKYGPAEAGSRVLMRYSLDQRADLAPSTPEKVAVSTQDPISLSLSDSTPPPPEKALSSDPNPAMPRPALEVMALEIPPPLPSVELAAPEPALSRPAIAVATPELLAPRVPRQLPAMPPALADVPDALPAIEGPSLQAGRDRNTTTPARYTWRVQLASSKDERALRGDFSKIRLANSGFDGLPSGVSSAQISGRGVFYRAWVGAFSSATDAEKLCAQVKIKGGNCTVMRASSSEAAAG